MVAISARIQNTMQSQKSLRIWVGKCGTLPIHRFWYIGIQDAPCPRLETPSTLNKRWRIPTTETRYIKCVTTNLPFLNYCENIFSVILICITPANNTEFNVQTYVCSVIEQKDYTVLTVQNRNTIIRTSFNYTVSIIQLV